MRHARRRKVTTVALGCGEEFAVHDVSVPLGPGDAMVTAVLLSVKPGAAGTTTVKLVVVETHCGSPGDTHGVRARGEIK